MKYLYLNKALKIHTVIENIKKNNLKYFCKG